MKTIKVIEWTEEFKDKPVKASTINIISACINEATSNGEMRGFDKFRQLQRIAKAVDERKDKKLIELEDEDYKFLKGIVKQHVPAQWGLNKKIGPAVEELIKE